MLWVLLKFSLIIKLLVFKIKLKNCKLRMYNVYIYFSCNFSLTWLFSLAFFFCHFCADVIHQWFLNFFNCYSTAIFVFKYVDKQLSSDGSELRKFLMNIFMSIVCYGGNIINKHVTTLNLNRVQQFCSIVSNIFLSL